MGAVLIKTTTGSKESLIRLPLAYRTKGNDEGRCVGLDQGPARNGGCSEAGRPASSAGARGAVGGGDVDVCHRNSSVSFLGKECALKRCGRAESPDMGYDTSTVVTDT